MGKANLSFTSTSEKPYDRMKMALLFYHKLVADLDLYVANKDIDGHQTIICWQVNNLMIGHKSQKMVK
jgi:hypothetical protein